MKPSILLCVRAACASLVLAVGSSVSANCPASVKVGSPDSPLEIGEMLRGDPEFARMHLAQMGRILALARNSCREGVQGNCELAQFLAEAKLGLECHAGISSSPNTDSQMHMGSARDMDARNAQGSRVAAAEECRCGSDYVACWVRNAKRSGARYQVTADRRGIVFYDASGHWSGKKGLNPDGSCSAVVN